MEKLNTLWNKHCSLLGGFAEAQLKSDFEQSSIELLNQFLSWYLEQNPKEDSQNQSEIIESFLSDKIEYGADFTGRLQKLINENYSTRKRFAQRMNLRQDVIGKYIKGQVKPNFEFFEKLGNKGININWLFTGKGEALLSPITQFQKG